MCLHVMSAPRLLIAATLTLLATAHAAVISARNECDGGDGVRRIGHLHHVVVQDAADQCIACSFAELLGWGREKTDSVDV